MDNTFKLLSKKCPWRAEINKPNGCFPTTIEYYCRPSFAGNMIGSSRDCSENNCAVYHFVTTKEKIKEQINERSI